MSKTTIMISVVFLIISILVNIFAGILEKIVEKKKINSIKNSSINDIGDKDKEKEN